MLDTESMKRRIVTPHESFAPSRLRVTHIASLIAIRRLKRRAMDARNKSGQDGR